jgi:hypothetical protein
MGRRAFLTDGFARTNIVALLFAGVQSRAAIVIYMKITGRPLVLRAAPSVAHDR